MAAYAALLSLTQTAFQSRNEDGYLFSVHAQEKIRSIHEYVKFMLSFLDDFPEKAKRWEGRIRDVAHEIEDIIVWHQTQSRYVSTRPPLRDELNDVTEEIGLIAGQMMEDRPAYSPTAVSSSSTPARTRNNALIGLDEDVISLKERLCEHSTKLQVIPIVGMAGIGKTTLARTLYEDQLIFEYFHIRVWLTVSQDYSEQRILLDLVEAMKILEVQFHQSKINKSGSGDEEMGESELETKIYQNLKGRRYLIVMDDVWSEKVWDYLMCIFPDDKNGSRIMLTTRLMDLATYTDPYSRFHEMQFMDEYQSWDLLKQKVFRDMHCPSHLEDVGKEIAQKCSGLPLKIVLVAGVLCTINSTRASWEKIAGNLHLAVESKLEEIFSLSYTHLPHHLRPCFLFIGGFPEDESIRASRLIRLWIAEGFLKHDNGCSRSLEEEAEEYLENLVRRNLVIVTSRKSDGKIKSCSLHDIIRVSCIRKAEEEKFLHVVDGRNLPHGLVNGRRISFSHSDLSDIWSPSIRTILCFQLRNCSSWQAVLQNSELLRVLNAVGYHQEFSHPPQVFQLFHLTYIALNGSFRIPSAISNLVNLQTLIIHPAIRQRTRNSSKDENHFSLPSEIWRMRQLRHVILYDPYMLPQPHDRSDHPLENLQTLLHVENFVCTEKMVKMIPNVKKLGIVYTSTREYHLSHLYLLKLEKLQVNGFWNFSGWGQDRSFPRTLKKLILVGGRFTWGDISIIGLLPNLQVLKLRNHACHDIIWVTRDGEFPELKYLLIDISFFEQWITQSSPFPRLQHLVLRYCPYLQKIPEAIGEISTLETIEVVGYCTSTLLESLEDIKEYEESFGNDLLQIRHIISSEKHAINTSIDHRSPSQRSPGSDDNVVLTSAPQNYRQLSLTEIIHYRRFSLAEILLSTDDFNDINLIGKGGYGHVYKGLIDEGSVTVAVKRLTSKSNLGKVEFEAKVQAICNARHRNLVSLIGYCRENREIILVYEYMANRSLADHLYSQTSNGNASLTWNQRLKICLGAARGLDYLHTGCSLVHLNFKSTNIFLDENFTTRVSDFGVSTNKEIANIGRFTRARDTYDFGVVLLEVLSGRRSLNARLDEQSITDWARDKIRHGKVDEIVDPSLKGEITDDSLKRFAGVTERCLYHAPNERPTMSQVADQLELALELQLFKRG